MQQSEHTKSEQVMSGHKQYENKWTCIMMDREMDGVNKYGRCCVPLAWALLIPNQFMRGPSAILSAIVSGFYPFLARWALYSLRYNNRNITYEEQIIWSDHKKHENKWT